MNFITKITKTKHGKLLLKSAAILFGSSLWILIWSIAADLIDLEFIFPGPMKTFQALLSLIATSAFWSTVVFSFARILYGFIIGVIIGSLLAVFCRKTLFLYEFISIGMTVIKSTPVASIIMILWVLLGEDQLPCAIGVLMVAPIIWQNLINGYDAIDNKMAEVCDVFEFSQIKRFKHLTFPTLIGYFVPAALTSIGLAWKSGIAAEIITYAKNSIGRNIQDAKQFFEGDKMLAWTLVVIFISLVLEKTIAFFIRRFGKHESYS